MIIGRPERPLPPESVCIYCGYDLLGLPSRQCPECGRITPRIPQPPLPGPPPPLRWYHVRAVVVCTPVLIIANGGVVLLLLGTIPRGSRMNARIQSVVVAAMLLAFAYSVIAAKLVRTPQDERWAAVCFAVAVFDLVCFCPAACVTIQ